MVAVINDPWLQKRLIEERRRKGIDQHDEVWEGVYMMAPMANDEHQFIVKELTAILTVTVDWTGLGTVRPGVNISDRIDDWKSNYRCPDVAVFLADTEAKNCDTFWYGGPDLAIEIISPNDQAREKLDFYSKAGTKELLIIDRDPWQLELYRLTEGKLVEAGRSNVDESNVINSESIPLTLQLVAGEKRPRICIAHTDSEREYTI